MLVLMSFENAWENFQLTLRHSLTSLCCHAEEKLDALVV
jgi:hypothetical protein